MGSRKGTLYNLGVSLFRRLTGIYPDRFRRKYASEIFGVLVQRLEEVYASGGAAVPVFILHESGALIASIIREHWHARRGRKEVRMKGEERLYHEMEKVFLKRRLKHTGKVVLLLAALIPLYYGCTYAYTRIQIAQAKQRGVFPTLEEAVYSLPAEEYRGARLVRLDLNHAEPCFPEGRLPFIWCVSTTEFYDRNPAGFDYAIFREFSTFYHLREGWVVMPEQIFPEFIGGVMEMYGMEGVGDYK